MLRHVGGPAAEQEDGGGVPLLHPTRHLQALVSGVGQPITTEATKGGGGGRGIPPWLVVQGQRRPREGREEEAGSNGGQWREERGNEEGKIMSLACCAGSTEANEREELGREEEEYPPGLLCRVDEGQEGKGGERNGCSWFVVRGGLVLLCSLVLSRLLFVCTCRGVPWSCPVLVLFILFLFVLFWLRYLLTRLGEGVVCGT